MSQLLGVLSLTFGGGGLLLFAWFLSAGAPLRIDLAESSGGRLAADTLLCLVFFLQHSGMVRRGAKERIARHLPAAFNPALYSVASGLVLVALVLLWQPVDQIVYAVHGPARWLLAALSAASIAGFAWGVIALGGFDPFGTRLLRAAAGGTVPPTSPFVIRGPYRFVRHPLYLFVLLMIWADHQVTTDRLLFNALWSVWIVAGTLLEERDLRREFGHTYVAYQQAVPMLFPLPIRRRPASSRG